MCLSHLFRVVVVTHRPKVYFYSDDKNSWFYAPYYEYFTLSNFQHNPEFIKVGNSKAESDTCKVDRLLKDWYLTIYFKLYSVGVENVFAWINPQDTCLKIISMCTCCLIRHINVFCGRIKCLTAFKAWRLRQ